MTARQRATDVISPTRAFIFAAALSFALILVLAPVFPGETTLSAGDPAFKTFRIDGDLIVEKGDAVDQAALDRIRTAGLLDNSTEADAVAAAVIVSVLGGALVALYLYLFQPPEVNDLARLAMVGLIFFLWVAAAKVFLSLTLPDDDRLYLGYILPVASAGMLIAALLDGGLAIVVAALLAVLASFAAFYLPDAASLPPGRRRRNIWRAPGGALEPLCYGRSNGRRDDVRGAVCLLVALASTGGRRSSVDTRRVGAGGVRLRCHHRRRHRRAGPDFRRHYAYSADGAGAVKPPTPARPPGEGARYLSPQRHRRQPG